MPITRTDEFNKMLEAQQNLVAGYDAMAQLATIEDLMCQQSPWSGVLRGAVLASLTNEGIKAKNLEAFKRDFLHVRQLKYTWKRDETKLTLLRYMATTTCPF